MNSIKQKLFCQLFIIYTRYLIGGAFVFASLIKIKGYRFTSESGASNPIDSAWHFFETLYQSGLYWQFIGFAQLIGGFFLMTQRFSKLGALITLPIMLNIFVVTLSYNFAYTPVITGLMLMANLLLIIWEWNELKIIVNLTPKFEKADRMEKDVVWQFLGLVLFLFTFIYRLWINKYNLAFWFVVCVIIGFVGFLLGLKREKKKKENSTIVG